MAEISVFSQTDRGNPQELIERGREILSEAKEQKWLTAEARASAFVLMQLAALHRYDEMSQYVAPYLQLARRAEDTISEVIILTSALRLDHDRGDLEAVQAKRSRINTLIELGLPTIDEARAYLALGSSSMQLGNFFQSLEELERARVIFEIEEYESGVVDVLDTVAGLHEELGNYEIALRMYRRIFNRFEGGEPSINQANNAYHISSVSIMLGDFNVASEYARLTWQISEALNDELGIAYAQGLLAQIAFETENYQEALEHLALSTPVFERRNVFKYHFVNVALQAKSYAKLGAFDSTSEHLGTLKSYADAFSAELAIRRDYWDARYFVEREAGNLEAALDALLQKTELDASMANRARMGSINRLLTEFGVREQDARNELLEKQNQRVELELESKKRRQLGLTLAVITVSVLTLLIAWAWMLQVKRGRQMRELAMTDPLTQAPNRRAILEIAEHEFERRSDENKEMSLVLVDVDHFKRINDNFGHHVGDNTLKAFAQACQSSLRQGDYYGRIGGEEWMLVLPDANKEDVTHVFNRIRTKLNAMSIEGLPDSYPLTFSMGACLSNNGCRSIQEMMTLADNKVYLAKDSGRDRVVA